MSERDPSWRSVVIFGSKVADIGLVSLILLPLFLSHQDLTNEMLRTICNYQFTFVCKQIQWSNGKKSPFSRLYVFVLFRFLLENLTITNIEHVLYNVYALYLPLNHKVVLLSKIDLQGIRISTSLKATDWVLHTGRICYVWCNF